MIVFVHSWQAKKQLFCTKETGSIRAFVANKKNSYSAQRKMIVFLHSWQTKNQLLCTKENDRIHALWQTKKTVILHKGK
jgi:hypothetical protein